MKRTFLLVLIVMIGCSKGKKSSCRDNTGGFIPTYSRVFYKGKDFGSGPVAIEIKYESGSTSVKGYLKDSYPGGGVTCSTTSGIVKVSIGIGEGFTYRAYDANRTWAGAVEASCIPNSCETIEIK
jgi:hypothetical protein